MMFNHKLEATPGQSVFARLVGRWVVKDKLINRGCTIIQVGIDIQQQIAL